MKIVVQESADNDRIAIERERLRIDIARFDVEMKKEATKSWIGEHVRQNLSAFVVALVSVVTLVLSVGQVAVAHINKTKDLEVLRQQQENEWRYKALQFVTANSEAFYGEQPETARRMAGVLMVGFPLNIAKEMIAKIQDTAPINVQNALKKGMQEARSFSYLDWDGKPWRAEIQDGKFVKAPKNNLASTETVTSLSYLTWDGSKWKAVIENGIFRHMRNGETSKSHPDTILNYLDWDRVPSTKSLF
jgi:hypothetical protein